MSDDDFELIRGSGNVYADFGYPDADVRLAKLRMAVGIAKILDERGWTNRRAQEATGFSHADFARIRNANLSRFTLDRLMGVLTRLGQHVELAVTITPRKPEPHQAPAHLVP